MPLVHKKLRDSQTLDLPFTRAESSLVAAVPKKTPDAELAERQAKEREEDRNELYKLHARPSRDQVAAFRRRRLGR